MRSSWGWGPCHSEGRSRDDLLCCWGAAPTQKVCTHHLQGCTDKWCTAVCASACMSRQVAPGAAGRVRMVPPAVHSRNLHQAPAPLCPPASPFLATCPPPPSPLQIKQIFVGKDFKGDVPLHLKIAAGLTTGAVGICVASPTDLVKVRRPASCPPGADQTATPRAPPASRGRLWGRGAATHARAASRMSATGPHAVRGQASAGHA